ncbi:MAG: transporter [Verrucomicrobiales bacterium]
MNHRTFALCLLSLAAAGAARAQYSAHLPDPGTLVVTPTYMYSYYDDAWIGTMSMPIEQDQHSGFLAFQYSFTDRFALDATVGYTWADIEGMGNDDGLTDTTFGLRAGLLREVDGHPLTAALRVGGIIAGSYDEEFPFSAGDGANGVETSLLVSKSFTDYFGFYGDIGYRWRSDDVPEDFFGSAGLYVTNGTWSLAAGYRGVAGQDGPDIGAPGFGTDFGFPQVKEIQHNLEVSLGYTTPTAIHIAAFYAHTLDGRNTGEKNIFGLSVTIPIGGSQPPPEPAPEPVLPSK